MSAMQPSMKHVLEVVFALPPDSPVHRAMEANMYTTPEDFIMETDETIDDLILEEMTRRMSSYQRQELVY